MFGPHDFEIVRLFLLLVRIKNMFLFDEGQAEKQFHYRTVMMNWLFTPNTTYQELATKSVELWNQYLDYESVELWNQRPIRIVGNLVRKPPRGREEGCLHMDIVYYACYNSPFNFHPGGIRLRKTGY